MFLSQVVPLNPAIYSASVLGSGDKLRGSYEFLVRLDVNLSLVSISRKSFESLELGNSLLPGDACTVRISWTEMCDAALQRRTPTGEIVAVSKQESMKTRRRSSHQNLSAEDTVSPSTEAP